MWSEYWSSQALGKSHYTFRGVLFSLSLDSWTANCLWINSLASYWLHSMSEVHLNTRNPIMHGREHSTRGLSKCYCYAHYSVFLFVYLQSFSWRHPQSRYIFLASFLFFVCRGSIHVFGIRCIFKSLIGCCIFRDRAYQWEIFTCWVDWKP